MQSKMCLQEFNGVMLSLSSRLSRSRSTFRDWCP